MSDRKGTAKRIVDELVSCNVQLVASLPDNWIAELIVALDEDSRIRNAYLAEIGGQNWADLPDEGNVIVQDGVVHLWGAVRSSEVRKAMTVAALNVPGVKGVEDHMNERLDQDAMTWGGWPAPKPP